MKANHRTCKSYPKGRTQAKCSEASTTSKLSSEQNTKAAKPVRKKCYAIKFPYKLPKLPSQKWCKLPPAPLLQNYHCCHRRQCCPCCKLPEKSNRRPLALRNINYRHDAVLCRCQITPTIRVSAMLSSINHLQVCCFVRVSCSSYNRAFSYAGLHNHLPGVLTIEIVASNQRTLLVD